MSFSNGVTRTVTPQFLASEVLRLVGVFLLGFGIVHYSSGIASNLVTASVRPTSLVPEPVEYDTFSIFSGQCHCANLHPTNAAAAPVACDAMLETPVQISAAYVDRISAFLIAATFVSALEGAIARSFTLELRGVAVSRLLLRYTSVGFVASTAWLNIALVRYLHRVAADMCPVGRNLVDFGAVVSTGYYARVALAAVNCLFAGLAIYLASLRVRRTTGVVVVAAAVLLVWNNLNAETPTYFEIPDGLVFHLEGRAFAPGFRGESVGLWHVCDCKPFVCEEEQSTVGGLRLLLIAGAVSMAVTLIAAGFESSLPGSGSVRHVTMGSGAVAVGLGALGWQFFRDWFMNASLGAHCAAGVTLLNNQQFAWGYYLMGMPGLYWFAAGLALLAAGAFLTPPPH
jgi:hypothetical protein